MDSSSLDTVSLDSSEPIIVASTFRDILIKTINMLPPRDFIHLASTSKDMRSICLSSPGVSIHVKLHMMIEESERETNFFFAPFGGKRLNWAQIKELNKLPLRFSVSLLGFFNQTIPTNTTIICATRYFLEKLNIERVCWLIIQTTVVDWKEMISLAKLYKVKMFICNCEMPEEEVRQTMNMGITKFDYKATPIHDDHLISTNSSTLNINAEFLMDTAWTIIKRWLNKDIEITEWAIERSFLTANNLHCLFRKFVRIDADEYEGDLPEHRPFVIIREDDEGHDYYLVREDNNVINVHKRRDVILLSTENFNYYPAILNRLNF